MSPRTGRPKSNNPKSFCFSVRLDELEYALLMAYCKNNNSTKGEVARAAIKKILEDDENKNKG